MLNLEQAALVGRRIALTPQRICGRAYSWASIEIKLNGKPLHWHVPGTFAINHSTDRRVRKRLRCEELESIDGASPLRPGFLEVSR